MVLAKNIGDVIQNHVVLETESIDRIYLNACQPMLQTEGGVFCFFKNHRGNPIVSTALMSPMTKSFINDINGFASESGIDIHPFEKKEKKEDVMHERLKSYDKNREGVVFIGKSQEKFSTFRSSQRRNPKTNQCYPWLYRSSVMCNQYYFYIWDADFGPMFIKFSSYFPYTARICINGHEYAKRQLAKEGIAFEELDNGFLSCEAPERLQEICDDLDHGKIRGVIFKWFSKLPSPFAKEDVAAGFRYDLSILQIEMALTQVFDNPVRGRRFFEETIRENLDMGRPDNVSPVFGKRITKRTPGKFRTRVVTQGVFPTLYVSCKNSKIKQYFKEGRALRTETTINNPREFNIPKRLANLPAMRETGFSANRRLPDVQKVSHDCMIGDERLDRLMRPVVVDNQRGSALKFGDFRVMALFNALCVFIPLGRGFKNMQMRELVAHLMGETLETYSRGKMTYDLRRLKLHGLIEKIPKTFFWKATGEGIRVSLFVSKLYNRILRPGLSEMVNEHIDGMDRKSMNAIKKIDEAVVTLIEEARLAA